MQIYICQNRRYQSALRCSSVAFFQFCSFHDSAYQKPFDISQKVLVGYIMFQKLHEPVMVNIVKEAFDVRFENIVHLPAHYRLVDISDYLMGVAVFPKSVGAVKESRLVYIVQYVCHDSLYQLILIAWQSQRTLLAVCFGDIYPFYRQWLVLKLFHSFHKLPDVFLGVFIVPVFAYSVYAHRFLSILFPML